MSKANPRIVVVIEGGLVSEVYAEDMQVDVLIVDKDCEGSEDYSNFKIKAPGYSGDFDANTQTLQSTLSPKVVKQLFDQVD